MRKNKLDKPYIYTKNQTLYIKIEKYYIQIINLNLIKF